jgi:cytochrome c peroxidase
MKSLTVIPLGAVILTALLGAGLGLSNHRHSASTNAAEVFSQPSLPDDEHESTEPIQPIPLHLELNETRVALGARMFRDTRLSADNTISCASCHSLEAAGVDGRVHSIGVGGRVGGVNAPTVFNSGFNFKQFWDGRADSLETQAAGPVHNPLEMASDWPSVLAKLRRRPGDGQRLQTSLRRRAYRAQSAKRDRNFRAIALHAELTL